MISSAWDVWSSHGSRGGARSPRRSSGHRRARLGKGFPRGGGGGGSVCEGWGGSERKNWSCAGPRPRVERKTRSCAEPGPRVERKTRSCAEPGPTAERKSPSCARLRSMAERKSPSCAESGCGSERKTPSCAELEGSEVEKNLSTPSPGLAQLWLFLSRVGYDPAQLRDFLSRA